jgi:hypothetical protein
MANNKHENQVKNFLHSKNLTEHTLMQDNFKDRAVLQQVRANPIFDYFTPSDASYYCGLNGMVMRGKKLKLQHFVKLEKALITAQRLQSRNLKRQSPHNPQEYKDYKKQIDTILLKYNNVETLFY